MSHSYRLNAPDVTCEIFDGEALVVNLRSGAYYSVREAGLVIWRLLLEGWPAAAIGGKIAGALELGESEATACVAGFIAELEAEALIVPGVAQPPVGSSVTWAGRLAPPVLERYTDMQELLKLDPIHEVDVTGWPVRPASEAKN